VTQPDPLIRKSYAWFREGLERALAVANVPPAQRAAATGHVLRLVGLNAPGALPAAPELEDFGSTAAAPESIAYAGLVVAESLCAVETTSRVVGYLQQDPGGDLPGALSLIGDVVKQIQRVVGSAPSTHSSAFALAKILLTLSGDAHAAELPHAKRLAAALAQGGGASQNENVSAALALLTLALGALIDRAFQAPSGAAAGWIPNATLPSPAPSSFPTLSLPLDAAGPGGAALALVIENGAGGAPAGVRARITKDFGSGAPVAATGFKAGFRFGGGAELFLPFDGTKPRLAGNPPEIGFEIMRQRPQGALVIGPLGGATLRVGELGVGCTLKNGEPRLDFFARKGRVEIAIDDSFLADVLAGSVAVDFEIEAEADARGKLRLKNGSALRVTLPVPKLPTGPFKIQLINFAIEPQGGLDHLKCELSASFSVTLGPFAASVDRLGIHAELTKLLTGTPAIAFGMKPPSGIGLVLDAGIVKGGGYLNIDPARGEYSGTLELELIQIGVKAIAILTTKSPAGWSLLLMIYGDLPPIQLSWGFTLTGVGGLIGLQHTLDQEALSRGLSTGALDAILFPENPVADAPQIINTLRTLFPIQRGGFIIGPMLEVGWGTPNLVTVRLGLLIEASQFTLLGQAVVQIPPLVSADLAVLRLQVDFVGSVRFDPFRIAFDAMLRDSRVLFVTLTGQFAFRLEVGDHPTFLMSAGGFHPRFNDVPSDLPQPFQRIGAGFDIGIIGVEYKGYFAITAATVQAGSELRIWAGISDVASIEGGWGFDAICYLEPKFYFEIDMRAYVTVKAFGGDFAGVRVEGLLAGPGRWRLAGRGYLELPLLPDVPIDIDESWGQDRETPRVTKNAAELLAGEIRNSANWSAQLPHGGESLVTLARLDGVTDVLAHPLSTLVFRQKLLPWGKRLTRLGLAKIDGANTFAFSGLNYGGAPAGVGAMQATKDYFAAAQFFEVKEEERLQGSSFVEYESGVAFAGDAFALEVIVAETLDYEVANLSEQEPKVVAAFHAGALDSGLWVAALGAAAHSPLRAKEKLLPLDSAKIAVNPPPVVLTDRHSQQLATPAVFGDFWSAKDEIAGAALDPVHHQVAELFEITA
jgi:hypothetical protein